MQTETGADAGKRRGVATGLGPSSTVFKSGATVGTGNPMGEGMNGLESMGCAIFLTTDLKHPFENFTQHCTVTSDALGTPPFAAFALGVLSAFACNGLFADAADLVENGMAT